MEKPLVTIYTVTRNRADLLPRAMRSVLNQTYENIEYIIIDSASTDNTKEVVASFNDSRIRYFHLDVNKTCGECFNMAYELATGKYVSGLDDDDEYHLDKIEKQVALFETLPEDYGMVYCWMTYYDNQTGAELKLHRTDERGDVFLKSIAQPTVSGTPTLLVRKSIFNKIGGYKEADEIGVESDWEFSCRICRDYKVDYVQESLVNVYINHSHTRMSDKSYYKDLAIRCIKFESYFLNEFKDGFEKLPSARLGHYYSLSRSYFAIHSFLPAIKYYSKMLQLSPTFAQIWKPWAAILLRY